MVMWNIMEAEAGGTRRYYSALLKDEAQEDNMKAD